MSVTARLGSLSPLLLAGVLMAQTPPVAPVRPVVETHFGVQVTDHYRYFENFQAPEVQAWVKGQAEFAEKTLHAIPGRDKLLARIKELDAGLPYNLFGIQRRPNGDLFYFKQSAGENTAKVYFRSAAGEERLLLDADKIPAASKDDHYSIAFFRVSPDGGKLLYGVAASGSEQTTLKVFDVARGADLPDAIDRLEFEYAQPDWLPDSKSFVYARRRNLPADAPATEGYKFTHAFRHTLGEDVDRDPMVFANGAAGSPAMGEMDFPAVVVSGGSSWLIGQVKHGDETDLSLYATPRESLGGSAKWIKVCDRTDQVTDFAVHGDHIYLLTAKDAPRYKLVRLSLAKPDFAAAETIIPAGERVLSSVGIAKDALYVGAMAGVPGQVLRVPFAASPTAEAIAVPADEPSASVAAISSEIAGVFLATRSWTRAARLYAFDPVTGKLTDTTLLPKGKYDAPDWLTSADVKVKSHDGVEVPLSIVYRKDLPRDGSHPALLTGYGAYGATIGVRYDPVELAWLERGGVLAFAHVRGGGAFGKEWHHAGRKLTKPNTWKDFIACAEYLVREKFTSPQKLAGKGGSAGGILIGRAITERPELFAAAQIAVGCVDMARFETTMNGPPNVPEFGSLAKEDECKALLAMSALHHIRDGERYPAVILTHGVNDPRVEAWMSAKATARFQAASASKRPVIFRVDYHAGHGIGSTKSQRQEELADVWSFFLQQFGETK